MTTRDCIDILQTCSKELQRDYGIRTLRLFGSMARGENHEDSDIDVFVETETANPFLLMNAKEFLEQRTGLPVDIIRSHENINPRLRKRIEHDGIAVF